LILTPISGSYGLRSWVHWKDTLNLLLLLAPVPLAMLIAAIPRLRSARPWPRELGLLLAGSLWLVLLMSLLFMKLGAARDWDLYAAQAPVFIVAAFIAWLHTDQGRADSRAVGIVVLAAFFVSAPWFWLNAGEERSRQRFRDIISDMTPFQQAYAHEALGKHYRSRGLMTEALGAYRATSEIFPGNPRFSTLFGAMLYNRGDREGAWQAYQKALAADSTYAPALEMVTRIHFERNEPDAGLGFARRLAGQPGESAAAAELHGRLAENLGHLGEAQEALKRALAKAPGRVDWMERAAGLALFSGEPERAEILFRQVLEQQPASLASRSGLAFAIWQPISEDSSAWARPEVHRRLREAERILDELMVAGQGDPQIEQWLLSIRSALGSPSPE
jgi:tetratricopeptide (TPR) repeat protein